MSEALVKTYYTGYVRKEWRRLVRDAYHRLELDTTLYFLKKHFPKRGLILDAGGGPGRYTVTLASQGYDIASRPVISFYPRNSASFRRYRRRGCRAGRIGRN